MSKKKTPPRGKNGRFLTKRQIAARRAAKKRGDGSAARKAAPSRGQRPKYLPRQRAPKAPKQLPPKGGFAPAPQGQMALPFPKPKKAKSKYPSSRTRESYWSKPKVRREPSHMYAGRPAKPYYVQPHHRPGYRMPQVTIPAHDVQPRYIWGFWANPGVPEWMVDAVKAVGGAALATAAIYGTGKILQKTNFSQKGTAATLAGAGVVGGAALSVVSPAVGVAVAAPLMAAAVAVFTGSLPVSGAKQLVAAMGEIRRVGQGGVRQGDVGEIVRRRPAMRALGAVEGLAARA